MWIEPHVLYKYGFGKSSKKFISKYMGYLAAFALIMAVTFLCNNIVKGSSAASFVLRCIISGTIPNIMMVLLYSRSEEFKYFIGLMKRMFKKKI